MITPLDYRTVPRDRKKGNEERRKERNEGERKEGRKGKREE